MGIFRLFKFYKEATSYVSPDQDAVAQAGESGKRHAAYHKRIVLIAVLFGALGGVLGVILSFATAGEGQADKNVKIILLAPFMFGAIGILFGAAIACAFAPREFLTGPVGQKWMKLIGTKSVSIARFVCLLLGLIVLSPCIGIGLLIALGK